MKEKIVKYFMIIVVSVALLLGCTAQVEQVDLNAEKAAVKETLVEMVQAMQTENLEAFSNLVAHDSDMVSFGTDEAERWVGWDALKSSLAKQFAAFDSSKISVSKQVIHVGPGGQVAWFSEIMNWKMQTNGQPVNLEGMRSTGVLEKRNGKWVFVQMHFSVPVSGQAAEY